MPTLAHALRAVEQAHDLLDLTYAEVAKAIKADESTMHRLRQYALWTDAIPVTNTEVTISAATKFVGDASDSAVDVRGSVAGDSIWNGVDDNGSTSVALLAIARAWVKQPSKRSALFFSTNLHSDYHTPRDEPKRIDYEKLTRMTRWMYMTGWIAVNAAERPAVDSGFVLH